MQNMEKATGPIHRTDYVDREGNLLESETMTPRTSEWMYSVGQGIVFHSLPYRVAAVRLAGGIQRVTLTPCTLCPYCGGVKGDGDPYGCYC
jgi:hypothetical protein